MLSSDIWGSIVKMAQDLLTEVRVAYPHVEFGLYDWEAHANTAELPEMDLIGPTAVSITEHSPQLVEVSFALAVSTYSTDEGLFRQRNIIGRVFEKMRSTKKIPLYDAETAQERGYMIFTDGTTVLPMTKAEARPFQYVQGSVLLEPSSSMSA